LFSKTTGANGVQQPQSPNSIHVGCVFTQVKGQLEHTNTAIKENLYCIFSK